MDNSIEDIVASIDSKGFYATDNFSNEIIKDVYNISDDAFSNPSINAKRAMSKLEMFIFFKTLFHIIKKFSIFILMKI